MKTALPLKKMRFAACFPSYRLLKQSSAASGFKRPAKCFLDFDAVKRMKIVNFTRREILEEVSPRKLIHPSIERTVSSHE
jgi:hypothetical protein